MAAIDATKVADFFVSGEGSGDGDADDGGDSEGVGG